MFEEAAAAGYRGLELGPYGYVPLDLGRVGAALQQRGLSLVAGTIFDHLVAPMNRDNLIRQTDEICSFVSRTPKVVPYEGQRFPTPLSDRHGLGPR